MSVRNKELMTRGQKYEIPGFNSIEMPAKSENGRLEYDIPYDGGGGCKWKLSNLTASFQYRKNELISHDIDEFVPVSTRFVFDNDPPQSSNGLFTVVDDAGKVFGDYYPLETFDVSSKKITPSA